jgi:hypothetical protein
MDTRCPLKPVRNYSHSVLLAKCVAYVCVYVRPHVHICTYVNVHICTHACMQACVLVCMRACVCVHVCMYVCMLCYVKSCYVMVCYVCMYVRVLLSKCNGILSTYLTCVCTKPGRPALPCYTYVAMLLP